MIVVARQKQVPGVERDMSLLDQGWAERRESHTNTLVWRASVLAYQSKWFMLSWSIMFWACIDVT